MLDEENSKRQERIAIKAQQSLSLAKLPPRMEKHEELKKIEKTFKLENELPLQKTYNSNLTFKPVKRKKVPNFDYLQQKFQMILDQKKSN